MNVILGDFDANKQVAARDEQNTFGSRLNVKLDCDGDFRPALRLAGAGLAFSKRAIEPS